MLRLKQLRIAKNMSREELGEIVGLSKSMIAAFEQGKRTPRWETIQKFCAFFKVTTEYLMEEEEKPKTEVIELELIKGSSDAEFYIFDKKPNKMNKEDLESIVKQRMIDIGLNKILKPQKMIRLYISGSTILAIVAFNLLAQYGFSIEIIECDIKKKEYISQGVFKR